MRPKLSYANVVSTVSLFLLLGGGAYAAIKLPKNSVGSKQLKKNAVTGSKVKDHSLLSSDFKNGQLPKGELGPEGKQGPKGEPGTPATALWAALNSDGTLRAGSHVVASSGTNPYTVTFDRDISNCALVASPNGPSVQLVVSAVVAVEQDQVQVFVVSRETGVSSTSTVSVAAFCSS
jgi:hypothetical protein